jgi:hypothetical protein
MSEFAGNRYCEWRGKQAGWSTESFRAIALERLRSCTHIGRLSKELGGSTATLWRWRSTEAGYKPVRAVAQRPVESLQQENERLERALAEKTLEMDFLQGTLQQVEARQGQNIASGASASTPKSGQ